MKHSSHQVIFKPNRFLLVKAANLRDQLQSVANSTWGHFCEITNIANTYWNDTISTANICRTMIVKCDRTFNRLKAKCGCIRVEAFVAWRKKQPSFCALHFSRNCKNCHYFWLLKQTCTHVLTYKHLLSSSDWCVCVWNGNNAHSL